MALIKKRDMAYIVVFGSLWGIAEISFGAYLHALAIPFVGIVMSSIAVVIMLTGCLFTETKFALFYMGAIAAFLKLLSLGNIVLTPFIAIVVEGFIAQIIVVIFSKTTFSFILSGGLIVVYTFGHRILKQMVFFGRGITEVYVESIEMMTKSLGIDIMYPIVLFAGVSVGHFITGGVAGWVAWYVGNNAKLKLGYS